MTLWDYVLAADDPATHTLIHMKFLLHFGHETGAIRHPESQRALRTSLQRATLKHDGSGLHWMTQTMTGLMNQREIRVSNNPRAENLCAWMYEAFVTVQ